MQAEPDRPPCPCEIKQELLSLDTAPVLPHDPSMVNAQNSREDSFRAAFLIIYLGPLPDYFDFWARSCEPNQDHFHWFVYSDQVFEKRMVNPAVTLIPLTFEALCHAAEKRLGFRIPPRHTRIVCDCRLILYPLRKKEDSLDRFDMIGYSDLDVVYGKIMNYLPPDPETHAMISGHDNRPCGPFTLFSRSFLLALSRHPEIKAFFEQDPGEALYESREYSLENSRFKPMSGNREKDRIARSMAFSHLDESETITRLARGHGRVLCNAHPLQPAASGRLNHRKAVAVWDEGMLTVSDVMGRKAEGAFFHFSRFKNRSRFRPDPSVLKSPVFGVYKYGFLRLDTLFARLRFYLTLLY